MQLSYVIQSLLLFVLVSLFFLSSAAVKPRSTKKKLVVPVVSTRSRGSTSVAVSQVERARTLAEWKTLLKEALVLACNTLFIWASRNQATLARPLFNHYLNNEIDDQIVTLDPVPSTENASSPLLGQLSAYPVPPFIFSPGIQEFLREQLNQFLQEHVVPNL